MSSTSSDDDGPWTGQVDGYQFEPEYTEEEMRERERELAAVAASQAATTDQPLDPTPPRLGADPTSWCKCGNCTAMDSEQEHLCCHEHQYMAFYIREIENTRVSLCSGP